MRPLDWTEQGSVLLERGTYLLDFQVLAGNPGRPNIWGAFDAFCLTLAPFAPNGSDRPE
jgi:hypothetical protein